MAEQLEFKFAEDMTRNHNLPKLEKSLKEARTGRKLCQGLLATSALIIAPLIYKIATGTMPETNNLANPWNTYMFLGSMISATSFLFGTFGYAFESGDEAYYQSRINNLKRA